MLRLRDLMLTGRSLLPSPTNLNTPTRLIYTTKATETIEIPLKRHEGAATELLTGQTEQ